MTTVACGIKGLCVFRFSQRCIFTTFYRRSCQIPLTYRHSNPDAVGTVYFSKELMFSWYCYNVDSLKVLGFIVFFIVIPLWKLLGRQWFDSMVGQVKIHMMNQRVFPFDTGTVCTQIAIYGHAPGAVMGPHQIHWSPWRSYTSYMHPSRYVCRRYTTSYINKPQITNILMEPKGETGKNVCFRSLPGWSRTAWNWILKIKWIHHYLVKATSI